MVENYWRRVIFRVAMTIYHQNKSNKLIREYVSAVLKNSRIVEDDGGYDGGYSGGEGVSGYGSYGSGDLFQAFIQPFVDIVGTIAGKTKEVMRSAFTALHVAFESLVTTIVPFLTDSYDEIFIKEKQDLAEIRSQYQGYYDATDKALAGSGAKLLAFMAFPGAALTGQFAVTAPKAAKSILSMATGGISDEWLGGSSNKKSGPSGVFDSYVRAYNKLLTEAGKENLENPLASKIKSKKFIDTIISRSPPMQESSRLAMELHIKTRGERIKLVLDIYEARSLEELGKIIGKPVKTPDMKEVDPEQKMSAQEAENKFLEAAKSASQKAAIETLKKYIAPVRQAFGEDHPFVSDYDTIIAAFESGDVGRIEQVKKQLSSS